MLVEMPTESEFNAWLSLALQLYFIRAGLVKPRRTVLSLVDRRYQESTFQASDRLISPLFPM